MILPRIPPLQTAESLDAKVKAAFRRLIVDLIEHQNPRRKKTSRIEVTAASLCDILAERPHLAQLALF